MEILGVLGYFLCLIAFAAFILYCYDKLSKRFGDKQVLFVMLGIIPFILGSVFVYFNFNSLVWWQIILYPFSGILIMLGVILLATINVIPNVIFELLLGLYEKFKKQS